MDLTANNCCRVQCRLITSHRTHSQFSATSKKHYTDDDRNRTGSITCSIIYPQALGNHDFDDGPAGVVPYIAALKAPVLAANMDTSEEPSFEGLYKPHIIVNRKGRKIGIIGLITVDTKVKL